MHIITQILWHITFLKSLNRKRQGESQLRFNCSIHVKTCKFSPPSFRNSPSVTFLNSPIWILYEDLKFAFYSKLKRCSLPHLMTSLVSSVTRTPKLCRQRKRTFPLHLHLDQTHIHTYKRVGFLLSKQFVLKEFESRTAYYQ